MVTTMTPPPRNFLLMEAHAKFIKAAVVYNAVVFTVFYAIYALMDFSKHFTAANPPVTLKGKLYFAVLSHTQGGANDIVAKTDLARLVQAAHVLLAWAQLLLVFLR